MGVPARDTCGVDWADGSRVHELHVGCTKWMWGTRDACGVIEPMGVLYDDSVGRECCTMTMLAWAFLISSTVAAFVFARELCPS